MKRIRVTADYGGKLTQERRIRPGEYDVNDPALLGLAEYLVANRHAVPVESVVVDATPPADPAPPADKGGDAVDDAGATDNEEPADESKGDDASDQSPTRTTTRKRSSSKK